MNWDMRKARNLDTSYLMPNNFDVHSQLLTPHQSKNLCIVDAQLSDISYFVSCILYIMYLSCIQIG